jgi:hypothetical protein
MTLMLCGKNTYVDNNKTLEKESKVNAFFSVGILLFLQQ